MPKSDKVDTEHKTEPNMFWKHVKDELKAQKLWTDLTRPLAMDHVVATAKAKVLLKHDLYLYYDDKSNDDSDEDKKAKCDSDTESNMRDDDMLSEESDDENQMPSHRCKTKFTKNTLVKKDAKLTSKEVEPKSFVRA